MNRSTSVQSASELLEKLVSFDTTSAKSNLGLIAFVRDYLAGFGIRCDIVPYQNGAKANLVATIGTGEEGGIILSGHTDVVPANAQEWESDPFGLTRRGSRLYGRGTADMKGFLAVVLGSIPTFLARPSSRPIHIALSCDEEVGCGGAKPMIRHISENHPPPVAVIVGEPTLMQVVTTTKGVATYVTELTGQEAHSSDPRQGVNAIAFAGHALLKLERLGERLKAKGDPTGCFDPPYASVNVGVIAGGTVKNIVPGHCSITWEIRFPPGIDPAAPLRQMQSFGHGLEARMRAGATDCRVSTTELRCVAALAPDTGSYAETLVLAALRANRVHAASYATEAGLFQAAGMPTVICGPGSIEQAHKPNEYIEIAELEACAAFMQRLVEKLSA